jgi:single-strand DNA-binding protein
MSENFTVSGLVATSPRHLVTQEGLPITSFRLASSNRRYDRTKKAWVDGETNWFTVTSFRQLAINSASSISKGDRIVATGRLKVRDWDNGERTGTSVEIEADSLGPDLTWGTSEFTRTVLVREDPIDEDLDETELDDESELVGAKTK